MATQTIEWFPTFEQAAKEASVQDRLVLVDLFHPD